MDPPRRSSVRMRLRAEDVSTWISSNQPTYPIENGEAHVRFAPPLETVDDLETESNSTDSSLTEEPRYLNGGYGWLIVFFSFILHLILDGASFSFGVIFPKIQEHFQSQRVGASSVASLFLSFPLILSPIAGYITDVCDCKRTIIIGGIIAVVSAMLSFLCPNIQLFSIVFGGGVGLGMCFVYNAAIVIVTYYFEENRGIATSLAVSGTGCGTFFFPFYLSWMSSVLPVPLYSSILAIMIAMSIIVLIGFLVRDVEWVSDTQEYKEKMFLRHIRKMNEDGESVRHNGPYADIVEVIEPRRAISLPSFPTNIYTKRLDICSSVQSVKEAADLLDQPARSRSVGTFIRRRREQLPTVPEYSMITNLEHLDLHLSNSPCTTIHSKKFNRRRMLSKTSMSVDCIDEIGSNEKLNLNFPLGSSENSVAEGENLNTSDTSDSEMSNDGDSSSSELSDKVIRKEKSEEPDKSDPKKLPTVNETRDATSVPASARHNRASLATGVSGMNAGRVMAGNAVLPRYRPIHTNLLAIQAKMPSAPSLAVRKKRRSLFAKLHLKAVIDCIGEEAQCYISLLKTTPFVLLIISVASLYCVLDVPYVFFFDHATENLQIKEGLAKYLTPLIGIMNVMSTYCYGYLGDMQFVKDRIFFIYGLVMLGIAAGMVAAVFVTTFHGMMTICILFGLLISANYVWQSIMLTLIFEDMGIFQSAYSFTSFCEGVATLIGPPLIGWIRDAYGDYTYVFYMASIMCLISGLAAMGIQHYVIYSDSSRKSSISLGKTKANNTATLIMPENHHLLSTA